nr:immunoglobulin heavy chain junction region [Mus musculus]
YFCARREDYYGSGRYYFD